MYEDFKKKVGELGLKAKTVVDMSGLFKIQNVTINKKRNQVTFHSAVRASYRDFMSKMSNVNKSRNTTESTYRHNNDIQ